MEPVSFVTRIPILTLVIVESLVIQQKTLEVVSTVITVLIRVLQIPRLLRI